MTTDNLPAVRHEAPVATTDTDTWVQVMGPIVNLANHIAKTEFVPKGLRGNEAATAAAMLYGREVGLPPMTALNVTHVIEGKPGISAEAMRAMVFAAGHEIEFVEATGARCVIRGRRRGQDSWTEVSWTTDMARAANLLSKSNWKSYPRDQLVARATTSLCRMIFPDVIHGFRTVEELEDMGDAGSGSVEGTQAAPSSTVQRRTRRGNAKREEPVPVPVPPAERPDVAAGPPLPGEEGFEDVAGGGEPPATPDPVEVVEPEVAPENETRGEETSEANGSLPAPADPPRPATKADIRMYQAAFSGLGTREGQDIDRDVRLAITSQIIGRDVDTANVLAQSEARLVADTVARCRTLADLYALLDATTDPAS